ncbi:MAG TPA: tRNA (adenosine(37)-N6)-threonylcarbamoyltransferase complex ATPase subunit type 1 TsaE [Myxococcota bacterium]|nr:tRNA (adenosine(37)-N6)-threonylcarbamoyltransferase complex ATPase subunit type 1 TsaE [Myxococcota bacterium]HRY93935.1 tRNA (adenosine(37)-N6)-threonylcarbamoyltransferase complex ATPase subunit type 1 TsaE [Myxococcota bacterium]HSA23844.1 tRNA (adenosine(37)-N6)-threonylcarbamoyltransferase complex ATPase subunit type 1 TsaE [Myxococcota bacterium]
MSPKKKPPAAGADPPGQADVLRGTTRSSAETQALGRALGEALRAGDWLGLTGELGAGKTCFVQGLARGLGAPPERPVTSPTFVLLQSYPGRVALHHLDLYRLKGGGELAELGYDELCAAGVCAVEWFDVVAGAQAGDGLVLSLELRSARVRAWEARALGPRGRELLGVLEAAGTAGRRPR